jgi:hypothetical protein
MEPWVIRFGDHTLTSEQATGAHLSIVADLVGDEWSAVSPWAGPRSLMAWLVAMTAANNGGDLPAALADIYSTPVMQITDCLSAPEPVTADD